MATEIVSFICLDLVGDIETVDLLKVFAVTIAKSRQLVVSLTLLALQASVGVIRDLLLMLNSLDVDVTI